MKILLVSGIYPPDIGGPATFIPKLAEYLSLNGHDVTVLSYKDSENQSRFSTQHGLFRVILIRRNQNKIVRTLLTFWKIFHLGRSVNITLLNGLYYEHAIVSFLSTRPYIYKIVGDPVWEKYRNTVNCEITIEKFQEFNTPIKYSLLRKILTSGARKASLVIVPGQELRDLVSNWDRKIKVKQVNNGVPSALIEGVEEAYDVISVSRLVNWKNIDLLIDACEIAKLSLLVVGDGPERSNLENHAKHMSVKIHFLGEQHQENIRNLLHKADIYALISSYEGMSFSLLEAMMQERKILVSDIPANTSVIQDHFNGMVVGAYDAAQIAKKLSVLKNFENLNLKHNARHTALSRFSDENILHEYSQLIERHAHE
jgi:glycosyltransferase involved in cell wall biosynthesis